jgi:hypothetical protein
MKKNNEFLLNEQDSNIAIPVNPTDKDKKESDALSTKLNSVVQSPTKPAQTAKSTTATTTNPLYNNTVRRTEVAADKSIKDGEQGYKEPSEAANKAVVGKLVGNHIECADPKLIIIEQQYLKYVKGYKDIIVDGRYGGETHGYLRASLGVKTPFAEVVKDPSSVCKFVLFPDGLTKRAGVSTFDALTQLIQSKMPKGETVGVVPKITTKSVKANTNPYKNYRIYTFSALPQNIKVMLKTTYGGNTDAATVRNRLNGPGWILSLNDEKNTLIDIRQDIGKALDSFSGLKESWSIRNKNKYTENLFERLITSINNGENK